MCIRDSTFYVGKNSKLKYVEKHYAEGDGSGERIMNPTTVIYLEAVSYTHLDVYKRQVWRYYAQHRHECG